MASRTKATTRTNNACVDSGAADHAAKVKAHYDSTAAKLMAVYAQGKLSSYHYSEKTKKSTTGDRVRSGMKASLADEYAIFAKLFDEGHDIDVSNTYCYVPYLGICGNIRIMSVSIVEKAAAKESRYRQACMHNGLALMIRACVSNSTPLVASFQNVKDGDLSGDIIVNKHLEDSIRVGLDENNRANKGLSLEFSKNILSILDKVATIVDDINGGNGGKVNVNVDAFNTDEEFAQMNDDRLYALCESSLERFRIVAMEVEREATLVDLETWTSKDQVFEKKTATVHSLTLDNILYAAKTVGAFPGLGFGGIPKDFQVDRAPSENQRMSLYTFCDTNKTDLVRTLSYAFDLKIDGVSAASETKTGGKGGRRTTKSTPEQFQREMAAKFLQYAEMKSDGTASDRKKKDACADSTWVQLKAQLKCLKISDFNAEKNTGLTLTARTTSAHKLYPQKTLRDDQLNDLMGDSPNVNTIIDIILASLYASNEQVEDTKPEGALAKIQNGLGYFLLALGKSQEESEAIVLSMKTTRVEYNPASRFRGSV